MRPGKKSAPRPKLDLRKIWAELKEEPPGPIQSVPQRSAGAGKNIKPAA